MSTTTLTAPITTNHAATPHPVGEVDSRAAYTSFALAYIFGHGAAAASQGTAPLLDLPSWLPMTLLGTGLAAGTVHATIAAALERHRLTTHGKHAQN